MNIRVINPIDMQMVKEYLTDNLRIESSYSQEYGGSLSGYEVRCTIKLVLDGEEISSTRL